MRNPNGLLTLPKEPQERIVMSGFLKHFIMFSYPLYSINFHPWIAFNRSKPTICGWELLGSICSTVQVRFIWRIRALYLFWLIFAAILKKLVKCSLNFPGIFQFPTLRSKCILAFKSRVIELRGRVFGLWIFIYLFDILQYSCWYSRTPYNICISSKCTLGENSTPFYLIYFQCSLCGRIWHL